MSGDQLPSWRETPTKQSILQFVDAVTSRDSADYVEEPERVAVFDNDGTLWTEQPVYAQLIFALDRAAELGHPTSLEKLHAGGMAALIDLMKLTHAGITTDEFAAFCRGWLASARHPRFDRPYPAMVYQPMLELLGLLSRNGFSCWIFSGGGTDFMRAWATEVYGLPPHRVIGSVGETEFRNGADGPELVKTATIQIVNDGPQKPISIHRHVGGMADPRPPGTPTATWLCFSGPPPARTGPWNWSCTTPTAFREYAYDRDPILGAGPSRFRPPPRSTTGP